MMTPMKYNLIFFAFVFAFAFAFASFLTPRHHPSYYPCYEVAPSSRPLFSCLAQACAACDASQLRGEV